MKPFMRQTPFPFQKLGTALRAAARTQINVEMRAHPDLKAAEGLREFFFPILWFSDGIEDGIEDPETLNLLRSAVSTPETVQNIL